MFVDMGQCYSESYHLFSGCDICQFVGVSAAQMNRSVYQESLHSQVLILISDIYIGTLSTSTRFLIFVQSIPERYTYLQTWVIWGLFGNK